MLTHEQFMKNAERWSSLANTEIEQILKVDCRHLMFCKTGNDELNIKVEAEGKTEYFHSPENTLKEAQDWFASLRLDNVSVIYVYGVGLGYYYDAIKQWLHKKEERLLIFLERDLAVIHRLLETEKAVELLNDKQVLIYLYDQHLVTFGKLIQRISSYLVLKEFEVSALKYYKKKYPDDLKKVSTNISFNRNLEAGIAFEYMSFGTGYFNNFYSNLLYLPSSQLGNSLFGKFKGVPAIICGAGPSLEKNLDLLSKLKDKALIFAGGTAMNAINSKGILPHFGVGIDPNWYQYTRLITNIAYEVPYFYRNRMYHNAFKLIHGDRLYVTGSIAYEIANWFENKLDIHEETIEEGFNVVNFSLSIAHKLGCNPIILVGVDLAYSNNQSYTRGIISHPIHDRKRDFATRQASEETLLKKDIYGAPVYTLWKWINESLWFTNLAVTQPDIVLVNSTEGGLGFHGIPNIPLNFVAENVLKTNMDLDSRIQIEILNAQMPEKVSFTNIVECIDEFKESLLKCRDYFIDLKKEFFEILSKLNKGEESPPNLVTDHIIKCLGELDNEPGYSNLLRVFNEKYLQYYGSNLRKLEKDETPETEKEIDKKKTELNIKRFDFLAETVNLQLKTIDNILALYAFEASKTDEPFLNTDNISNDLTEGEVYKFENETITILDPELDLSINEKFAPIKVQEDTSKSLADDHYTVDENGLFQGQYIHRYPQGQIQAECYYLDGNLHGPSSIFGKDGKLLGQKWYIQGKTLGKARYYYPNGKMKSLQRFRDGEWDGKQEYYYPDGQLKSILNYKNGLLNGEVLLYNCNGIIGRELNFLNGKRHGYERGWNFLGLLNLEVQWDMDRPTGTARSWYDNGILAKETTYGDNFLPKIIHRWDINGVPWKDSRYEDELDYFDKVAKQSDKLTHSIETVIEKLDQMVPSIDVDKEGKKSPGLKIDIDNLKKAFEHLQKLNVNLSEKSGLGGGSQDEALWKTPTQRKIIEKQLQDASKKMSADINQINEVLESTLKYLIDESIKIASKKAAPPPKEEKKE